MRVLDLFSGIGGFSLGLERAGMTTVAFCEIDPFCRQVLKKHWPDVPIYDDVTTFKGGAVGPIDVICGGFPCQDISLAGEGAGLAGQRSGLWREYARIIGEVRPRYVIVENVAALLFRGLGTVLGDLAALGFDAEWHCIPASYVGASHQRDRLWIVAYTPDSSCPRFGQYCRSFLSEQAAIRFGSRGSYMADADFKRHGPDNAFGENCGAPSTTQSKGHQRQRIRPEFGGSGSPLSNTESERRGEAGELRCNESEERIGGVCEAISDAECNRLERFSESEYASSGIESRSAFGGTPFSGRSGPGWFLPEPSVGRVADGVSGRAHRLKQLGNAVVPQIPELIGRAIMATQDIL